MDKQLLHQIAQKLVTPPKGILAADESTATIAKKLNTINLESTPQTRRDYREMLFTTPNIENFISGIILFDETIKQNASTGQPFVKILQQKNIILGIKVDQGTKEFPNHPKEKITIGLQGLSKRLSEYSKLGAKFSKWRAVITIGKKIPTQENIDINAHTLAEYANIAQKSNIVPIIEPEVLMTGIHTIKKHQQVTIQTLNAVFSALEKNNVYLPGILLKINIVASGLNSPKQANTQIVAQTTINTLKQTVPSSIPGIVFLSGGLTPQKATQDLNAINKLGKQPWELSYSFGRALQHEALLTWKGKKSNISLAQQKFLQRCTSISLASQGKL